jgi:hypothetical protein
MTPLFFILVVLAIFFVFVLILIILRIKETYVPIDNPVITNEAYYVKEENSSLSIGSGFKFGLGFTLGAFVAGIIITMATFPFIGLLFSNILSSLQ